MPTVKSRLPELGLDVASVLRAAIDGSPDCVKIVGRDGQLQFMNASGLELMQLRSFRQVVGKPWTSLWPAETHEAVASAIDLALSGEVVRFSAPCPTAKGNPKHWDVIVAPLTGADGRVAAVLATSRDVTELTAARLKSESREKALKRQAAELRSAGILAKLGSWEIDCVTGCVLWSDELHNMVGTEPRPMTLDDGLAMFEPEERPVIAALLQRAQETGERISYEAQITREGGQKIWCRMMGEPEMVDGTCLAIRGAAQDVTDMKEALEDSRRAQKRLKLAIEIADLHVYEMDYQARTLVSEGVRDTFFEGPVSYEMLRKNPYYGVAAEDRPRTMAIWEDAQALGRPYRAEYRVERSDGCEVWAASAADLVRDQSGKPLRLVGAMRNITDQKVAEAELRETLQRAETANLAKTAFLANMSHEIRTPLNGVIGMLQVMERDDLPERQRDRLAVIKDSSEILLGVLNNVLDISKIEAGRLELDLHDFDIADIVEVACRPYRAEAAQKDVAFELALAPDVRGTWRGDGVRLQQILGNLVSNAVKFTSAGQVSVAVREDSTGLHFLVRDTGIGMPPSALASIFEKFVQVDGSVSRRFGGTGLGLAICKDLVRLMNGTVEVASEPGAGSEFSFVVPIERAAPGAANLNLEPPSADAERQLRVLAVEDNATNQLVVRALLEPTGIDLEIASDGVEAVEAFLRDSFDLILMDIQMPRMSGIDATSEIRRIEMAKGLSRTPILALSANVMTHQVAEYRRVGMDGVVAKPIDAQKLYLAIQSAISQESEDIVVLAATAV